MSWPGWTPAAPTMPTMPTAVGPGPVQSTLLPTAINSAPSVLPPTMAQYSPEQWAQAQQQNWQQWAQWQQQYQQWHQQYGAEYQKSLTAMQTTAHPPLPAMATPSMAPPLPVEAKPPLPPEEPPTQLNAYMSMHSKPMQGGYSTAPPTIPSTQPPMTDPYGQMQGWQQNTSQKRPYSQEPSYETAKKPNLDKGNKWSQQNSQNQWQGGNQNFSQPPPQTQPAPQSKPTNVEELSEAEKKFDKEFAAWEAQFNKWKDQNANHPDKVQYKEYEKKWESWRNSLLERREQMRKKRVALTATKNQPAGFTHPPPAVAQPAPGAPIGQGMPPTPGHLPPAAQPNYSMPPPNQNNEPLAFKNSFPSIDDVNVSSGFLQSTPATGGGIPGLDLVKEESKDVDAETRKPVIELDKEERPPQQDARPDLDAISKGINTILGDQKLLSMLSMVTQKPPPAPTPNQSQNQGYNQGRPNFVGPDINVPPPTAAPYSSQQPNTPAYNDQSNQSYEDRSNQDDYYPPEDVNNFDDQTRSSFTMGPGDQDQGFRNRTGPAGRFSGDRMGSFGPGNARNNFAPGNQRFGPDNNRNDRFGPDSNRNDRFGGPRNIPESNFGPKGRPDTFGRGNFGSVSSEYDRFGGNRGNNRNDRFSNDNFDDDFQNERDSFGNTRNENFRSSKDTFNNHPGDYDQGDDYEDFDNYNEEDDYDKYHNMFIEDEQDEYHNNDYGRGNRDFQQNQKRDYPSNQRDREFPGNQNRGFQSNQNRDFPSNQNMDFPPPQRDFPANQNRDFPANQNRDFPPNQNRDFPPNQNRDFPPNQLRDFPSNQSRDFPPNQRDLPPNKRDSVENPIIEKIEPEVIQPVIEEKLFEPTHVIDYEHKSVKKEEPDVAIEPIHMFDYGHKPVNHIPNSQRPEWLVECVKFIREFDPSAARIFDKFPERPERYPGRSRSYEEGKVSFEESNNFERERFDRDNRFERDDRFNRERDDRFNRNREERFDRDNRFERGSREYGRDEFMDGDRNRRLRSREPDDNYERPDRMDDYNSNFDNHNRDGRDRDRNRNTSRDRNRDTDRDRNADRDRDRNADRDRDRNTDRGRDRNTDRADLKESFEDLSEDEMDWESGERNKQQILNKSRSASPMLSNPPNPATKEITTIEDIISPPGRFNRPPRIVIILRGPPGSGKTHLAKLIKDKEVEQGGSAPRILSLDDYFMVEQEKEAVEDGKVVKVKEMVYEYEAEMEESYRSSFVKSFKKTITDGYFPFIIVDNINDKVKYFGEMWSFAKQNGFQVYICQMDLDPVQCTRRNVHNRSEAEIEECIAAWEPTPNHHPTIDASGFLQNNAITEVEMEVVEQQKPPEVVESDKTPEDHIGSKWDTFDCSSNNLAKLDGVHKPLRKSRTMEEYLQLEERWQPAVPTKPGQKRVRWADLEEQRQLEKMKALGFVVGQTNWDKMMDPAAAAHRALRQTKYI